MTAWTARSHAMASLHRRWAAKGTPNANAVWAVTARYGVYTAAVANTSADSSSAADDTSAFQWIYAGAPLNADATAPTIGGAERLCT
jgi:hypothetical protein